MHIAMSLTVLRLFAATRVPKNVIVTSKGSKADTVIKLASIAALSLREKYYENISDSAPITAVLQ